MTKQASNVNTKPLRILTYNIQTGIAASKALRGYGYVTESWQHLLPSHKRFTNLDNVARIIRNHDIVALQETDAGSLRSHFVNQVEYLAHQAKFPYWHCQLNRDIGRFAQHSNGLISRLEIISIEYHALPGRIRGRGAMLAKFKYNNTTLVIINVHLSLGKTARQLQLDYLADLIPNDFPTVVLGDMNCGSHNPTINELFSGRNLRCATDDIKTYPSWRPQRSLDQAWVSPHLKVKNVQAKHTLFSDHLPVMLEVQL